MNPLRSLRPLLVAILGACLTQCTPLLAQSNSVSIDGAGNLLNPTLALPSGATLTIKAGATFDFSGGTIVLPANVATLNGSQTYTGAPTFSDGVTFSTGTTVAFTGATTSFGNSLDTVAAASVTGSGALVFGTTPAISQPWIGIGILDTNGHTILALNAISGAVNTIEIGNSAGTGDLQLGYVGTGGSNGNLSIFAKGTNGLLKLGANQADYLTVLGATSGNPVTLAAAGTNAGLALTTTGTGAVTVNGSAVLTSAVTSLTGTANQVIASAGTGAVTLSLPQAIATTSTPTFASATLTATPTTALAPWNQALNYGVFRQRWVSSRTFSIPAGMNWSVVNSGTSSAAQAAYPTVRLVSGTDVGGDAYAYPFTFGIFAAVGAPTNCIDFPKIRWVTFYFSAGFTNTSSNGGSTNNAMSALGIFRVCLGKTTTSGPLDAPGFGFEIYGASGDTVNLRAVTYDTTLHTSASLAVLNFDSFSANNAIYPIVHSCTFGLDGAGDCYVYVDNTYAATITTVPTAISASGAQLTTEVIANGSTTGNDVYFYETRFCLDD